MTHMCPDVEHRRTRLYPIGENVRELRLIDLGSHAQKARMQPHGITGCKPDHNARGKEPLEHAIIWSAQGTVPQAKYRNMITKSAQRAKDRSHNHAFRSECAAYHRAGSRVLPLLFQAIWPSPPPS